MTKDKLRRTLVELDAIRIQLDELGAAYMDLTNRLKGEGKGKYVTPHFSVAVYESSTRYLDPAKVAARLTQRQLRNCYSESGRYMVVQMRPRLTD